MKCIVIDNDAAALSLMCSYIENNPSLQLLAKFENNQDAATFLQNPKPEVELMFLNADMPGTFDLVKSLVNVPQMVFVSANKDLAYDAFKAGASDYILKPLSFEEFNKAVAKAEADRNSRQQALMQLPRSVSFEGNNRFIYIKSEYKVVRVNLDDIQFIESMREYVRFHLINSRPFMSLLTIKAIENYLPKDRFMRVHRSYIVNLDKINIIERARIVFDGDTFIPISEQYKEKFQNYLDKYFAQ